MANFTLYKADDRGVSSNGRMYTKHTFCFADYYDRERIHFGALRVINDMTIAPGSGLDYHPHADMELVILTLQGHIAHRDSLGHRVELHENSVQAMSTGTGYSHEEINRNTGESARILQFWIFPRKRGLQPDYSYRQFAPNEEPNRLLPLTSPNPADNVTRTQQDAWIYTARLESGKELNYRLHSKDNGVYLLIVSGAGECEGQTLETEDGMGIWETEEISVRTDRPTRIVLIEVPMDIY